MPIRVIDTETTGPDPATDKVLEIASVDLTKEGGITRAQRDLVFPGCEVPPEVSAIHHIITADVMGKPVLAEVMPKYLDGNPIFVAQNARFDSAVLAAHIPASATWVCTYKCALRIWPDFPRHSNQALRYRLNLLHPCGVPRSEISPHGALSDVIVTAAIMHQILKANVPWGALVEWSSEPALMTRLTFGKHAMERFDAVPASYLEWLIDKHDDEDVKHSARHWLSLR